MLYENSTTPDPEVFDGTKLSDLLKLIHDKTMTKSGEIKDILAQLLNFIKEDSSDGGKIALIMPYLTDFYDLSIKNDDQLVKIATIAQRLAGNQASLGGVGDGFADIYAMIEEESSKLAEEEKSKLKLIDFPKNNSGIASDVVITPLDNGDVQDVLVE